MLYIAYAYNFFCSPSPPSEDRHTVNMYGCFDCLAEENAYREQNGSFTDFASGPCSPIQRSS